MFIILSRDVPFSALYWPLYEYTKNMFAQVKSGIMTESKPFFKKKRKYNYLLIIRYFFSNF